MYVTINETFYEALRTSNGCNILRGNTKQQRMDHFMKQILCLVIASHYVDKADKPTSLTSLTKPRGPLSAVGAFVRLVSLVSLLFPLF